MNVTTRWAVLVKIDNEYTLIPEAPSATSILEFSESVHHLFFTGNWTANLGSGLFEEGVLVVGSELRFIFTTDSNTEFSIDCAILSVSMPVGISAPTLPSVLQFDLVSPWYFYPNIGSKAYKGTGSSVIKQVLSEYPAHVFKTPPLVGNSIDKEKPRYKTFQSTDAFIRKRVLPFTQGVLNSSFYVYGLLTGTVEAISYEDISLKPKSTLIHRTNPDFSVESQGLFITKDVPSTLALVSLSVGINMSETQSLAQLSNAKLIALDAFSSTLLQSKETSVLPRLGRDHARNRFTPVAKHIGETEIGYPIIDETLDDVDTIFSTALRTQAQALHNEHQLLAVIEANLNVHVGRMVSLKLQYNNAKSIYSQDFLVTGVSHVVSVNNLSTTLELTTSSFTFTNEDDVIRLVAIAK